MIKIEAIIFTIERLQSRLFFYLRIELFVKPTDEFEVALKIFTNALIYNAVMNLFLLYFNLFSDIRDFLVTFNFRNFNFKLFYRVSEIINTIIKNFFFNTVDKLKYALIILYLFHFLDRDFVEQCYYGIFLNLTKILWCTLTFIGFFVNCDYFFLNFLKKHVINQNCLLVPATQTLKPLNLLFIW